VALSRSGSRWPSRCSCFVSDDFRTPSGVPRDWHHSRCCWPVPSGPQRAPEHRVAACLAQGEHVALRFARFARSSRWSGASTESTRSAETRRDPAARLAYAAALIVWRWGRGAAADIVARPLIRGTCETSACPCPPRCARRDAHRGRPFTSPRSLCSVRTPRRRLDGLASLPYRARVRGTRRRACASGRVRCADFGRCAIRTRRRARAPCSPAREWPSTRRADVTLHPLAGSAGGPRCSSLHPAPVLEVRTS